MYIRWETALIAVELMAVIFLGFLPESAPFQIAQVTINFICSMQYNTFRQAQRIPMATTFCTNHLRQMGIAIARAVSSHGERGAVRRMLCHAAMLLAFVLGCALGTILCGIFAGRAIWFAILPLAVLLADLLYADRKKEREKLHLVPNGH